MSRNPSLLICLGAALAAVTGAVPRGFAPEVRAAEPRLVIVVAASSPLSNISKTALRRAFLAEPTVVDGIKLLPLNQNPGTPERGRFDRAVLDLSPVEMSSFWIDQRIRGQGNPPRAIPSVPLLARLVGQLPGCISYMRETDVPPGVKALSIDGRAPGSAGYLLP
jgi:hypothetical protein